MSAAANDVSPTADREIVITRLINAPRELVFKVWTDPAHVATWWGPKGFTNTMKSMDVRPGGEWLFTMHGPNGVDYPNRVVYEEVVPPGKLVYMHGDGSENDPYRFHVTVTFAAEGTKTLLTMRSVFSSAEARDFKVQKVHAIQAGNQTLDKLEAHLVRTLDRKAQHATFTVERTLRFPPEKVFAAWADPQAKARWFHGPAGQWTELLREQDFRVGGRDRAKGAFAGGPVSDFQCIYQDIVPNERIVYLYDMRLDDAKISVSLATVEFKRAGTGTRMMVTEQGVFLDGYDDAGARERGTQALMDQLVASLEGA